MLSSPHLPSAIPSVVNMESPSPSAPVWHTLGIDAVRDELQSDLSHGLTQDEATQRLARYGMNVLAQANHRSFLVIFLSQFRSLVVALLAAATVIAFVTGDRLDGVTILVVIVLNASIGFFTEWRAEQALTALQKQAVRVAHVIRGGLENLIPASELVPGDLVVLTAGARVPADGRVVESARLQIEEAALTGESVPITKSAELLPDKDLGLADRLNMAFLGTTITDGRGLLLVTATGAQSEIGKIGVLIGEVTTRATPLERKLDRLGRVLIFFVLILCVVIVASGWLRGTATIWNMLQIGISLAVSAVPEGLPAVTTMTLALGMQRMARKRALIRRLPAVETLGSVTVICTDKTGTLTKNEMTVCVYALGQHRVHVTGTGYGTAGLFHDDNGAIDPRSDEHLSLALRIGALCNDAKVKRHGGEITILGDPTEAALVVVVEKSGVDLAALTSTFPRLAEIPFHSTTKRMITVHRAPHGRNVAFVKGSPGALIAASDAIVGPTGVTPLTANDREHLEATNRELASAALRVLGLAYRELPENDTEADLAQGWTFVGLVGMSDPLRDEAKSAIHQCREAGIRIVMITGDQQQTAAEIARQLTLDQGLDGRPMRTIHGRELTNLEVSDWSRELADVAVFARVSPENKLQIVEALQQQGQVVAMTGDGVNDAPALKQADIGIAMGIKGTDVAKENADMVITDDNFASIVGAIEQGRIIYGNILRFLHYLLSCNLSELLVVFFALVIGWPLPLVASQLLWLNLVTDVFPAFALAMEPSAPDVMKRPPRDPREPLLTVRFIGLIFWQGLMLTGVTLFAFGLGLHWHGTEHAALQSASTLAFMTLSLAQVFHAFNVRSQSKSALTRRVFTNPWLWGATVVCLVLQISTVMVPILRRVLHTVPMTTWDWAVIAICSLLPIVIVEVVKVIQRIIPDSQNAVPR